MDYREFEETLCKLASVDAVRVVGNSERITEVHVLSAPEKSPKQVVRDIQSLAMARFGANVDRRVISVVQIAPDQVVGNSAADRPKIVALKEVPDGNRTTVGVTLTWHGEDAVGEVTGPAAASARLRLVGEATLRALEELLPDAPPLALDAIGAPAVGMRNVIIAVVVNATGTGEEVSVGSSLSHDDDADAAVRAVLDALNRRIPQLLR